MSLGGEDRQVIPNGILGERANIRIDQEPPGEAELADGYTGWAITEQPGGDTREGLADLAQRLGRILAS